MARVRIFSGSGRYSDLWHPFEESSAAIATTLREVGHEVEVRQSEPEAIGDLTDVDLLVVNSGGGDPNKPSIQTPDWARAHAALGAWVGAGNPVLAVHTAANAFRDWPGWADIVGATWQPGVSGHPERSIATFEPVPGAEDHPILDGLDSVTAYDERYWKMLLSPRIQAKILRHETGETFHDVVWVAAPNVVYDALGHDGRSYESPTRRRLLTNEVSWLLGNQ